MLLVTDVGAYQDCMSARHVLKDERIDVGDHEGQCRAKVALMSHQGWSLAERVCKHPHLCLCTVIESWRSETLGNRSGGVIWLKAEGNSGGRWMKGTSTLFLLSLGTG